MKVNGYEKAFKYKVGSYSVWNDCQYCFIKLVFKYIIFGKIL